jgi:hypothetical protein
MELKMSLTAKEKSDLAKAFRAATERDPNADKPIPGFFLKDGVTPATRRNLTEASLASGELYEVVDKAIAEGKVTLQQVLDRLSPKP